MYAWNRMFTTSPVISLCDDKYANVLSFNDDKIFIYEIDEKKKPQKINT